MAQLRTLVVDDEALARRNLTVLLRRDPDIQTIVECGSGWEAIEETKRSKPDLMFLDVQISLITSLSSIIGLIILSNQINVPSFLHMR